MIIQNVYSSLTRLMINDILDLREREREGGTETETETERGTGRETETENEKHVECQGLI